MDRDYKMYHHQFLIKEKKKRFLKGNAQCMSEEQANSLSIMFRDVT